MCGLCGGGKTNIRGALRGRERRDGCVRAPHAHLRRRVVLGGVHRLAEQRCNERTLADR